MLRLLRLILTCVLILQYAQSARRCRPVAMAGMRLACVARHLTCGHRASRNVASVTHRNAASSSPSSASASSPTPPPQRYVFNQVEPLENGSALTGDPALVDAVERAAPWAIEVRQSIHPIHSPRAPPQAESARAGGTLSQRHLREC
jgi:hypothetical protein